MQIATFFFGARSYEKFCLCLVIPHLHHDSDFLDNLLNESPQTSKYMKCAYPVSH